MMASGRKVQLLADYPPSVRTCVPVFFVRYAAHNVGFPQIHGSSLSRAASLRQSGLAESRLPPLSEGEDRASWECLVPAIARRRSEEHTSELQSLMRISYAVFCLKKKNNKISYT